MAEFIEEAAAMPEPNRKLVDFMYEAAWRILFEYRYGYPQDKVPAPWYDEVSDSHDKAVVMTAVTEGTQEG